MRAALAAVIATVLLAASILLAATVAPAAADPEETCAKVGNDDTVRPYEASLRPGFLRAFKTLFPDAKGAPRDSMMRDEGVFRCMDGRLVACFTGANLPCAKIDTTRDKPAVARYCAETGTADFVPLYVVGHESQYSYRCKAGRAEISGEQWTLDPRGFAARLWAPME